MLKLIIAFTFLIFSVKGKQVPFAKSWTFDALRLTGESSEIRNRAIRNLTKIPHLKTLLRKELKGARRDLALDVISALGFEDFVPELLQLAKNEASGIYYLSIDSLLTAKNEPMIARAYKERLLCTKDCRVSPVAQVLILDTLSQLGERLTFAELKQVFDNGWYEVKSAALNYVRTFLLRGEIDTYLPVLNSCLESPFLQLRWQAIYLDSELSPQLKFKILPQLKKCELLSDTRTPKDVKALCISLIGGSK